MAILLLILGIWCFLGAVRCVAHTAAYLFSGFFGCAAITAIGAAFWTFIGFACLRGAGAR